MWGASLEGLLPPQPKKVIRVLNQISGKQALKERNASALSQRIIGHCDLCEGLVGGVDSLPAHFDNRRYLAHAGLARGRLSIEEGFQAIINGFLWGKRPH